VFEEKDGAFEKSQRTYDVNGLAPTLLRNPYGEKILVDGRLRRLTLLETFRLQGFSDEVSLNLMSLGIPQETLFELVGGTVTVKVAEALAHSVKSYLDRLN
jgi:DNA (cytosine-5)-methyltransferase 1